MRRQRNLLGPQGMGGMVSLWGASSLIESVQRGTITITAATSNTATITAVDTARARLRFLGQTYNNAAGFASQALGKLVLTNSTTVTANLITSPAGDTYTISFEVLEYLPGVVRLIQSGTIANSGTAALTEVNTAKTELDYLGNTDTGGGVALSTITKIVLTNSTTVTVSRGAPNTSSTSYQAVEFF